MDWNKIANFNNWNPQFGVKNFLEARKQLKKAQQQKFWDAVNCRPKSMFGFVEKPQRETNPFKCPYVFIRKLEARGYKKLGAGCYSTVLWKSGDRVIKVNRQPDAWIDYILWANQKGYCGNLAPKVFSYKKIGTFYVAIVEKMMYTGESIRYKDNNHVTLSLFDMARHENELAGKLLDQLVPGARGFTKGLLDKFSGERLDLHHGNIMFRADGTMAVVDPVAFTSREKVIRLKARDFGLSLAC